MVDWNIPGRLVYLPPHETVTVGRTGAKTEAEPLMDETRGAELSNVFVLFRGTRGLTVFRDMTNVVIRDLSLLLYRGEDLVAWINLGDALYWEVFKVKEVSDVD